MADGEPPPPSSGSWSADPPPSYHAPPPPSAWPPQPYGTPPAWPPVASPVNGQMVLVLGILGLVLCHILAPFAWHMGNQALATLDAVGDSLAQRGSVNTGRICGIIGTVLLGVGLLGALIYVLIFVLLIAGAGSSSR